MNIDDLAKWAALIATILLSLATYRNSVRKADFDNLKSDLAREKENTARERDNNKRMSDKNAALQGDVDLFRKDIALIGENYAGMSKDVGVLVLLVNKLYTDYKKDTGKSPDIDWSLLDKTLVIQHRTTPLGPLSRKDE